MQKQPRRDAQHQKQHQYEGYNLRYNFMDFQFCNAVANVWFCVQLIFIIANYVTFEKQNRQTFTRDPFPR